MVKTLLISLMIGVGMLCPLTNFEANKKSDFLILPNFKLLSAENEEEYSEHTLSPNPSITAFALSASCTNGFPNNDAYLQLSAASDATHYDFSQGSSYSGAGIGGATAFDPSTDLPLQFGTLANPTGSQDYTIRVFNGIETCFTDVTVTLQEQDCSVGCDCTDYIYMNEVSPNSGGEIHKFAIATDGSVTEVAGAHGVPWYASNNEPVDDKMSSPHGLGVDTNGQLYIGETISGQIRKLDCSGNIFPTNEFEIATGGFNIHSIGNIIYVRRTGFNTSIEAYNTCTGLPEGSVYPPSTSGSWGFHIDKATNTFYNIGLSGPLAIFQPTLADFVAGTSFPATITTDIANPDPEVGDIGVLPEGNFNGITIDSEGFIYIVNQNPCGRIYKYHPITYELVAKSVEDCAGDGAGFVAPRGIVYSPDCDCLFVSSISPVDDCLVRFSTDLATWTTAVGPVPSGGNAKGVAINKECCPTNNRQIVDQTYCIAGGNEQLYLNEIFPCSGGTICEAQWMATDAASTNIFESCDQSIQANLTAGCYSFTRSSDGLNGKLCGAFEQTFNLEIVDIGTTTVSADQSLNCGGIAPSLLSINTSSSGTIQWQISTTNCFTGFTDIAGAMAATYQPPVINETTYYRAIIREGGGCSSNDCNYESDCITVTIQSPVPEVTAFALSASCANGVPNNDGFLQISAAADATHYDYSIGSSYTGSGIGSATAFNPNTDIPLKFGVLANPTGSQDYTIRVFNGVNCFTDVTVTLQEQDCSVGCNCTEMIYLNEPTTAGAVHKYTVNADSTLTEIGSPWFDSEDQAPGNELPSPHGLGTDLNGFLYIGEGPNSSGVHIRKLTCDGTILPESDFAIESGAFNITSIGNKLYYNTGFSGTLDIIEADICTGVTTRAVEFCETDISARRDWGMYIDPKTNDFYATAGFLDINNYFWHFSQSDFDNDPNTCINAIPLGGNFPATSADIRGVVTDNDGNVYIAVSRDNNMSPPGSYLLKYGPAPTFNYLGMSAIDNNNVDGGYFLIIGLVYSEATNLIYASTGAVLEDCIAAFDTDLNYLPQYSLPNTSPADAAKGIALIKECCPTNNRQTIDQVYCVSQNNEQLFLNELFPCDGIICEAQWTPTDAVSDAIFEACDQSIQADLPPGCYSFNRNSDGLGSKLCGAFEQVFNLEIIDSGTISISPDQRICAGNAPNSISVTTSSPGFIQWQISTTDCTTGFTDINGANSATYQAPSLSQNTYYRAIITESSACSSSSCEFESDCITITIAELLDAGETIEVCNDNNSPSNVLDDYITFSLNPTGSNLSTSYSVTADNGATVSLAAGGTATSVSYGNSTAFRLQNGSANGTTTYTITVTDEGAANCQITTTIMQNSCSTTCNLTDTGATLPTCNDNFTRLDTSDDFLSFSLNPTGLNLGATYSVFASNGSTVSLMSGGASTAVSYGSAIDFRLQEGSAGGGDIILTIVDDNDPSCTLNITIMDSGSCAAQADYPDYEDPEKPCLNPVCHIINNNIYLGSGVSEDDANLSNENADTDNDDGVSILPNMQFIAGNTVQIPINIYNNTGTDAYLRIWIDWNGDGDFEDIGEQVENNTYASLGTTTNLVFISVTIPLIVNQTKAIALRARLSTDSTNSENPCGNGECADDGEVEDYLLQVDCHNSICPSVELNVKRGTN